MVSGTKKRHFSTVCWHSFDVQKALAITTIDPTESNWIAFTIEEDRQDQNKTLEINIGEATIRLSQVLTRHSTQM